MAAHSSVHLPPLSPHEWKHYAGFGIMPHDCAGFDGVIVFDEAHAMANAAGGEGSRGKVKGSEQGIAGVRLQNLLPRARVLYASATGASDVNLAYATRLGLWGPETAFANREAFVAGRSISALRPSRSRTSRFSRTHCSAPIPPRAQQPICWNWK
jgi:hypothetical protein